MEGVVEPNTPTEESEEKSSALIDPVEMGMFEYVDSKKSLYRIYINEHDYTLAEAATAAEAIKNAEQKPFKVTRETKDNYYALDRNKLMQMEDGQTLYTDTELTELDEKKTITYNVEDFQAEKAEFVATDYTIFASQEANTLAVDTLEDHSDASVLDARKNHSLKNKAEKPPQRPQAEELSPEEVAELLEEKPS